ncbi:MAG: 2Fe-2S iron-sulfur cluster binding domain-containing protein [Clostridiales bacterium]|nr:2Fe-2S iron-sulfur cluster binding domain-containing protein [Clostridiales bacterium]
MREELKNALNGVSLDRFEKMPSERRSHIESAGTDMPAAEFNTNKTARLLHPEQQILYVSEVEDLPGAKRIRLTAGKDNGSDTPAVFAAGQYICVREQIGSSVVSRPYAISSSPADVAKGFYDITVKKTPGGFVSEHILNNFKDRNVTVSAPEGQFYYEPLRDAKDVIALAGGSGITPFYSMAQAIRDGVEDFNLTILYGCKKEDEIIYRSELDKISAECPSVKVIYVLSDEEKDGFEHGFITSDIIRKYASAGDYSIFVCGPAAMYDFCDKELPKLGLPKKRIRYEARGEYKNPEGKGKTYNLTVSLPDRKVTIPANGDESILVALERAGIAAKSSCRSGECGLCRTRLKSGSIFVPPAAEHRRAADIKDGFIHPCCTFPDGDCHIMLNYDRGEVKREVKDMKNKERKMGLIMAIIISLAMGILVAILIPVFNPQAAESQPVAIRFISNILMSVVTGIIVAFVVPLGKMGRALAAKAGANPPSMKFTLLNSIPMAVGNTIIVSLVCSLVGVIMGRSHMPADVAAKIPFLPMWLLSWAQLLLPTLVASYILAVLLSPFVSQAVGLGGPPTGGDQPRD